MKAVSFLTYVVHSWGASRISILRKIILGQHQNVTKSRGTQQDLEEIHFCG